jgi:DNA-binding PadR family transcriptional regulator
MLDGARLGRFAETARLVLVALRDGPCQHVILFDEVRALDGPVGPGTLYATVARLERLGLIEPTTNGGGRRAYRLTDAGAPGGSAATLQGIDA